MINVPAFRQVMGCFATGITVVTAFTGEGKAVGLTVNSLTSVSLDPPLISFCLDKKAHLFPILSKTKFFAVNILSEDQVDISQHFANYHKYPAPPRMWGKPQNDCPLLKNSLGWMACRKTATYKGGDHVILLGEVTRLYKNPRSPNPLVYFQSRYHKIKV